MEKAYFDNYNNSKKTNFDEHVDLHVRRKIYRIDLRG